jgi:glycogenin glucosyltransferase
MAPYPERLAAVSLVSSDSYAEPASVLGFTLRETGWRHATEVLVTAAVSASARETLARSWQTLTEVEEIRSPLPVELCWSPTVANYTKLRLWAKTEYQRLIYLDADMIVLGSLDEAIGRAHFAAAPCLWPPDRFNAGLLVLEPSAAVFADLMDKRASLPSYDGGDQGFLNSYVSDWFTGPAEHRLPAKFNLSVFLYQYRAAWHLAMQDARVLHFTGPNKPWRMRSPWRRRLRLALLQRAVPTSGGGPDPHALWWAARERMARSRGAGI